MRTNYLLATLMTVVTVAGCGDSGGDDDGSTTGTTPPATTMTTTMTGDEPTGTDPSTTTSGDEPTTADDTTGGGPVGEPVNGCDPATAVDMTGMAEVTINQVALKYEPPCVKVSAGTSVKFVANFEQHPLIGGTVADGAATPDAASPINETTTGSEASFTIATAGTYPYYCTFHALSGMVGAIYAQ